MKCNGIYKSEAEAYQSVRKHWKTLRNHAQRRASMHQWEAEHQDKHPQIKQMVMELVAAKGSTEDFHMPIERLHIAEAAMRDAHDLVSTYQHLLNNFKVKS